MNLLDPTLVVIGGGIAASLGDRYVELVARTARHRILSGSARTLPIVPSELAGTAGLLGAALTAYRSLEVRRREAH